MTLDREYPKAMFLGEASRLIRTPEDEAVARGEGWGPTPGWVSPVEAPPEPSVITRGPGRPRKVVSSQKGN